MNKICIFLTVLSLFMVLPSKAQNKDSLHSEATMALGRNMEETLRYREALELYKEAMNTDTANQEAMRAVARMAVSVGQNAMAENYFRKILATDSTDFFANYQLGRLFAQQEYYQEAIAQFEKVLEYDSLHINATVARNIGDCYMSMGDLYQAVIYYMQAHDESPENVSIAITLANGLMRLGGPNIEAALETCNAALAYNPTNRPLKRTLGLVYYMNRNFSAADSVYTLLLSEGDSSLIALKYGGASKCMLGRQMDAIPLLEVAYAKDTTDVETTLMLGNSLGLTYDRRRAYRLFDQAEVLMQPSEVLLNLLNVSRGETLMRDGRLDAAARIFYSVWRRNAARLDMLQRLSNTYNGVNAKSAEGEKSRALLAHTLLIEQLMKQKKSLKSVAHLAPFLRSMSEETFFAGAKEATLTAPDGKTSTIPLARLKEMINAIDAHE